MLREKKRKTPSRMDGTAKNKGVDLYYTITENDAVEMLNMYK